MSNDDFKVEYKGNSVPVVLKLVWFVLVAWGIYYVVVNSLPDLKVWLAK